MKKIKSILIPFAIFFLLFIFLIKDKIPKNIFCFLDIGTYWMPPDAAEINSSSVYGQSFVSNFDNLFMISIFIPAQNLNNEKEIYFHLKNNKNENSDLVTLKWKFNQIHFQENNFYIIPPDREATKEGFHFHFQFPPIKNSKDREFYFYFDSSDAARGEGLKLGKWQNLDYYEGLFKGEMFANHKPVKGFLAFRTYNTWSGSAFALINEIKLRLLQDKVFFFFYCALLLINFVAIIAISLKIYERGLRYER